MDQGQREALTRRFDELAAGYRGLKAEAESRVADWRWSRSISWWDDPRPLAAEREGERRGRLMRLRPRGRFQDQDQVGLDASGAPVVVRDHDGVGDRTAETFMLGGLDLVECARFQACGSGEFELVNLLWLGRADGRPVWAHRRFRDGSHSERYIHKESGRLERIESRKDRMLMHGAHRDLEEVFTPRYDDAGRLIALDADSNHPGWPSRRVWRLPTDRRRVGAWCATVEDGLVGGIPRIVGAAGLDGPLAAIALQYAPQSVLPPLLGVLGAAEREDLAVGADPFAYLWNPAEWGVFDTPRLALDPEPDLGEAMAELMLEWTMAMTHEPGRKLLNRVAQRLNAVDWPVAVTDDFVVFATDLELVETPRNLRAALPRSRLREFRRRGWLLEDE